MLTRNVLQKICIQIIRWASGVSTLWSKKIRTFRRSICFWTTPLGARRDGILNNRVWVLFERSKQMQLSGDIELIWPDSLEVQEWWMKEREIFHLVTSLEYRMNSLGVHIWDKTSDSMPAAHSFETRAATSSWWSSILHWIHRLPLTLAQQRMFFVTGDCRTHLTVQWNVYCSCSAWWTSMSAVVRRLASVDRSVETAMERPKSSTSVVKATWCEIEVFPLSIEW